MDGINVKTYFPKKDEIVKIGERNYTKVSMVDTREYVDSRTNDLNTINRISSEDGMFSVYLKNGKEVKSIQYYCEPATKNIGGKNYNNIHSCTIKEDGTKIYEIIKKGILFYGYQQVVQTPDGEVKELNSVNIVKTIKKIAKNALNKFKKLIK